MSAVEVPSSDSRARITRAPAHPSESRVRPSVRRTRAIGTLGDGPRNGDALLLATGELSGKMIAAIGESDEVERDLGIHRIVRDFGDERDVLQRREAGNEIVELEDKPT